MTATTLANQEVERAAAQSRPITRPQRRREIDIVGPLVLGGLFGDRVVVVGQCDLDHNGDVAYVPSLHRRLVSRHGRGASPSSSETAV